MDKLWQIVVSKIDGTKTTYTFNPNSPKPDCITKSSSTPRKYVDLAGQIHDTYRHTNYKLHAHSDLSGTLMYTADEKLDEDSDGTCSWLDSTGKPEICDHTCTDPWCCPSGEVQRCKDASHAECELSYMKVSDSYVKCFWASAPAPTPPSACTGIGAGRCSPPTDPNPSNIEQCKGTKVKNSSTLHALACNLQTTEFDCKNSYYIDDNSIAWQCYWD